PRMRARPRPTRRCSTSASRIRPWRSRRPTRSISTPRSANASRRWATYSDRLGCFGDLPEQLVDGRSQPWQIWMSPAALAATTTSLARAGHDDPPPRRRLEYPNARHALVEIPGRLLAQRAFGLVLTRDFRSEHGNGVGKR